ncbi:hypothetical protein Cgig2_016415 [Carnegiea gigantea]|uniref:Uncharacterized protein n=1 Tax=Carnegiea gigantea TaxID=171969 RepID=A0A9Q1Q449_9CARY|nr:hypothetical protein Cgig2_016409 [Carnegiea gigantea]KAJ8429132.1 hypothetical protein Cgig2_016415 [Carnegiea gigantea]
MMCTEPLALEAETKALTLQSLTVTIRLLQLKYKSWEIPLRFSWSFMGVLMSVTNFGRKFLNLMLPWTNLGFLREILMKQFPEGRGNGAVFNSREGALVSTMKSPCLGALHSLHRPSPPPVFQRRVPALQLTDRGHRFWAGALRSSSHGSVLAASRSVLDSSTSAPNWEDNR